MGLTVGSRQIADTRVQGVTLRPIIGGYELVFGLDVTVRASSNGERRASVIGARVTVKPSEGEPQVLGFARPEGPLEVVCEPSVARMTPSLHLYMGPGQLAALETLRGTGDLRFELLASGTGVDEDGEQHVQGDWRVSVARSDWIGKLRGAGARNVMLLEILLPLGSVTGEWQEMAAGLACAEEQFRNGEYHSCIGSCRTVIQELGMNRYGTDEWVGGLLGRLASDRKSMTKGEREAALFAVLRHYTHQAHHGPSEGGVPAYERAEALFVLSLTAAATARAQAG